MTLERDALLNQAWAEFGHVDDLYHIAITQPRPGSWAPTMVFTMRDRRALWDVPVGQRIPPRFLGCVTTIRDIGRLHLLSGSPDETEHTVMRGGIAVRLKRSSGTLCCLVRTTAAHPRGAGRVALLTCQHVLMNYGDVAPGTAHSVGQPESHPCCESCDAVSGRIVAHLRSPAHLSELADAAIAELKGDMQWAPEIYLEGADPVRIMGTHTITQTEVESESYPVWKRGITTGRTEGVVTMDGVGRPDYRVVDGRQYKHRDYRLATQIEAPGSPNFAEHGDSGAAVLNAANQIVGMCFAASDEGVVMMDPIARIEDLLHVAVATDANTPAGIQTASVTAGATGGTRPRAPLPARSASALDARRIIEGVRGSDLGIEVERTLVRHREEFEQLRRHTRLIAAWRRWGGPEVVERISAGLERDEPLLPAVLGDDDAAAAIGRFAEQVRRLASPGLRDALGRISPAVRGAIGLTVEQLVAASVTELAAREVRA